MRIREQPLEKLDPEYDVVVGWIGDDDGALVEAAASVLDHLAKLNVITPSDAARYREAGTALATDLADDWIRTELGERALREHRRAQEETWTRMYEALVSIEAKVGNCQVPVEVEVEGVSLGRWVYKQCTIERQAALRPDRAARLNAIPTWTSRIGHDKAFWRSRDQYLGWVTGRTSGGLCGEEAWDTRAATLWASALRATRRDLQAEGSDLAADKLKAIAAIPGWSWDPYEDGFDAKIATLRDHLRESGKTIADIRQRDVWEGQPIGVWINSWRTRRSRLTPERQTALETLPGWTWNQRGDQWDAGLEQLEQFGASNGHVRPSHTADSDEERALARWKRNNKNCLQGKNTDRADRLRDLLSRYGETMP